MDNKKITPEQVTVFRSSMIQDEKSPATIEKYSRDVEAFCTFVGNGEVTKETVIAYKQQLMERYAPASVNSMLAALNRFFKVIGRYDCVVKSLRIQRSAFRDKERELTKAEYYRLLKAAQKKNDMRLCMLMQTICSTGIRVSELSFITVEALRRGHAIVSMKGKTRRVLLPKALSKELLCYAKSKDIRTGAFLLPAAASLWIAATFFTG